MKKTFEPVFTLIGQAFVAYMFVSMIVTGFQIGKGIVRFYSLPQEERVSIMKRIKPIMEVYSKVQFPVLGSSIY